jgi:hypothetical protein
MGGTGRAARHRHGGDNKSSSSWRMRLLDDWRRVRACVVVARGVSCPWLLLCCCCRFSSIRGGYTQQRRHAQRQILGAITAAFNAPHHHAPWCAVCAASVPRVLSRRPRQPAQNRAPWAHAKQAGVTGGAGSLHQCGAHRCWAAGCAELPLARCDVTRVRGEGCLGASLGCVKVVVVTQIWWSRIPRPHVEASSKVGRFLLLLCATRGSVHTRHTSLTCTPKRHTQTCAYHGEGHWARSDAQSVVVRNTLHAVSASAPAATASLSSAISSKACSFFFPSLAAGSMEHPKNMTAARFPGATLCKTMPA